MVRARDAADGRLSARAAPARLGHHTGLTVARPVRSQSHTRPPPRLIACPPVAGASLCRYIADKPNEWEQKAFQLMVVRYLIGLGDELPPLRYRLLPASAFLNIEMLEARQALRLPVGSMVGVHCGYLKEEGDKVAHTSSSISRPHLGRTSAAPPLGRLRWSISSDTGCCSAAWRGTRGSRASCATRAWAVSCTPGRRPCSCEESTTRRSACL